MSIVGLCNFPMAGDQAFDALESKVTLVEHVTRLKIELKTLAEKVAAIPTSLRMIAPFSGLLQPLEQ